MMKEKTRTFISISVLALIFLISLSYFITLFCINITMVSSVVLSALTCTCCVDAITLYLNKMGYIDMKIGDYVLLSRNNYETDIVERVVGEIIAINDSNYYIKLNKITLTIDKKTLEVSSDDERDYKYYGVVQGSC